MWQGQSVNFMPLTITSERRLRGMYGTARWQSHEVRFIDAKFTDVQLHGCQRGFRKDGDFSQRLKSQSTARYRVHFCVCLNVWRRGCIEHSISPSSRWASCTSVLHMTHGCRRLAKSERQREKCPWNYMWNVQTTHSIQNTARNLILRGSGSVAEICNVQVSRDY